MPATSAFLQVSCLAKSDSISPVSTASKIKLCYFESLIRARDKILSSKESPLAINILITCILSVSIWYVVFCETWDSGSSCFLTD